MNLLSFFHQRRARELLADELTREQGKREGRVFIENWRELRRNPRNNIPEGELLPPRPKPSPAPPYPPGAPPRGGSAVTPPPPQVVVIVVPSPSK